MGVKEVIKKERIDSIQFKYFINIGINEDTLVIDECTITRYFNIQPVVSSILHI